MQARVTACQSLLLTPQKKEFLADLVTGDESWILYYNNTQRAVWIPCGEERPVFMRRKACFPASGTRRFLHDNARPHVAKATQAKLLKLNWDTVPILNRKSELSMK
uniref:Histone-lysine N-methyltransferase SETMAR n=1 Tax=Caenorhabditis japonica TaxID=281687 RepID=A0A8R1IQD9_CAEJA